MRRRGFTLIEMVVVMIVVGLLGIIAVGTFNAVRGGTDRAAGKATVRAVALAQQRLYGREGAFAEAAELAGMDDKFTYTGAGGASTAYTVVSVDTGAVVDPTDPVTEGLVGVDVVALAVRQDRQCVVALVPDPQVADAVTGSYELVGSATCAAVDAPDHVGGDGEWEM